ncbi:hypothetical protein E2F50_00270 [Rhizobium deserti]|uniref:HpcH/HpaI aldolase/citrate lyase domain-containing protein n=1 Tax=Rhizobium deserti TaxID=2547961 RepID=A0A4R5ULD9_9HYPH|nr:hypothetical protein [Rhizobium deserti]TDK38633.1 hypothetical protein E2F50_00270 [Rhizobium deserti]
MAETFKIGSPRSLTLAAKALQSWRHRSWLILPLSELAQKRPQEADWIVVDLTDPDSVSLEAPEIPEHGFTGGSQRLAALLPCWSAPHAQVALTRALQLRTSAVVLSAAENGAEVQRLDVLLRVEEARIGLKGETAIVAMLSDAGLLAAASFRHSSSRLAAVALQAGQPPIDRRSHFSQFARAQLILAARAAGALAIDATSAATDPDAFRDECLDAYHSGFAGKFSVRPDQVATINNAFAATVQPEGRSSSNTSAPPSA